jgi:NAD(P)-dependent dehydrogenase (short-subunit alcohol dehydrogenase family)
MYRVAGGTRKSPRTVRGPDQAAWVLDRIPIGRLGEPADLAGAVDGGWLAG